MKISKMKVFTTMFYLAYLVFLAFSIIGHIPILNPYLKFATYISLGIFIFIILVQINSYKIREFLIFVLLIMISLLIAYKTGDLGLVKLFLFLMAMKNVDFDKCISFDFKSRIFLILLVLVLLYFGYATDISAYNNGNIKHSLGFTNPNALGMHTLILAFEILYFNRKTMSLKTLIFPILLLYLVNLYAGSRTTELIILMAAGLFVLYVINPKFYDKKLVKKFISNSALFFSLLTLLGFWLYKYNTDLGLRINNVLSNRLHNIYSYYNFYSVNLFGNNTSLINLTLDTVYAYTLYGLGIIGFLIFIFMFKKLFSKLYEIKNYSLIIIIFSFLIYGLSERLWLYIDYNIFMASFIYIFFDKYKKN